MNCRWTWQTQTLIRFCCLCCSGNNQNLHSDHRHGKSHLPHKTTQLCTSLPLLFKFSTLPRLAPTFIGATGVWDMQLKPLDSAHLKWQDNCSVAWQLAVGAWTDFLPWESPIKMYTSPSYRSFLIEHLDRSILKRKRKFYNLKSTFLDPRFFSTVLPTRISITSDQHL